MALDFSTPLQGGSYTYNYRMVSRTFPPTTTACVTFSYYMRGLSKNEELDFFIRKGTVNTESLSNPLWYGIGEMGPFWYTHRDTVNSTINWQIVFGATASQTKDGLIAIDDVMVELDKSCPPKGRCDIEVSIIILNNLFILLIIIIIYMNIKLIC